MGYWKSGLDRARYGIIRKEDDLTSQIKDFFKGQEQVGKHDIVYVKNWVVDVEGSIHLFESDLTNGELSFKIGKLTGNLYCHCRHFKPSVIPTEMGGEIIFVLEEEEELAKYRTNTCGSTNDDDPFQGMQLITTKEPSKSSITTSIIKRLKTAIADSIDYGIDIDFDKLLAEVRDEQKILDNYKLWIELSKKKDHKYFKCDIYATCLDNYKVDDKPLKLTAINKAIYLMFIMHKEGIVLDDLSTRHMKMAQQIYSKLANRTQDEKNGIMGNNFSVDSVRGYRTEIRNAIKERISYKRVIDQFAVEGEKNQAFKVQAAPDELREQIRQAFDLD